MKVNCDKCSVILVIICLFSTSCVMVKPVQVTKVNNFRTANVLSKPELLFDIGVQNPNNFGVKLKSMGLNLFVGERNIVGLNIANSVRIQRRNAVSIPVSMHPSVADITSFLNSEFNNLLNNKSNQQIELRGEIVMKKFLFTRKIKLKESIRL